MADTLFYISLGLILVTSFLVILTNHPVFSLIYLILSFLVGSFLLFLLECEFLALIFITVYVGAIAVLFLFSIMMLDFKRYSLQRNSVQFLPASTFFGFILLIPLVKSIYEFFPWVSPYSKNFYFENNLSWFDFSSSVTEIAALGRVLYTHCALHLLVVGLILLVVLFGVVHLTNLKTFSKSRNQVLFKQLSKSTKLN